ncbi:MAG: VWA domain-containing protein [Bacteroidaceae bacterium]|nr:VWA domain-containing protein [Bacteroidaceae bacterium]
MFRFENPEYFSLLAVLVLTTLLYYFAQYRRKRNIRKIGDESLVKQLFRDVARWRVELKFWLAQLALLCMIVALARPQYGTKVEMRERQGIEAMIAMDVSNSMMAEDVRPCRLEKAKMMLSNMVDGLTDDKVGLIVFAGQAFIQMPITSDYVSAKMFLDQMNPSMVSVQGTDIAEAIHLAMRSFTPMEDVSRAIFIITDGEDNENRSVEAAQEAAKAGIRVYVLGIGDPAGAPIPIRGSNSYITDEQGNTVVSKLNEDMCRAIAKAGNGSYIYVDNSSSAQQKLDAQLETLSKTAMESQVFSEYDEQYQGFLILALFFLLVDMLLLERSSHTNTLSKLFKKK